MSKTIVALDNLGPDEIARFRELTAAPPVAWPTVILNILLIATFLSVYGFCGTGQWPLWLGLVVNTTVGYVAFSVAHDAIHRSISRNTRLNDVMGQLGMNIVLPYVDLRMFRWAHILHHRFANGPRDPDRVFKGPWWSLPFRWAFIDLCYFVYALRNGDKVSKPFLQACLRRLVVFVVALAALVWAGYGLEVLMLWFIPSRLIQMALGFSFFWLPHVPHDVSQEENFTRATTIRRGHEWLLGPVLQYQNFHLIHHLYPMTPFYNNGKVYRLIERELQHKELAVQHGFAIHPTIHPGASAQA
ncbi:fatty acid desaturase [Solimonas sp. K1W22B-7]|uniref:fatty acid desaturase n=1 Tax=Solimonas sp. K1W22B-7 TaxID=2303331 RepID=UPI000E32D69C|nr:fatty acid desaturase [Solimonas sp. K1W22B-7]AXQ28483.1 fatty acid desaturase [Solimonas sp. K1W22B-7]